jgi:hypothetical protein
MSEHSKQSGPRPEGILNRWAMGIPAAAPFESMLPKRDPWTTNFLGEGLKSTSISDLLPGFSDSGARFPCESKFSHWYKKTLKTHKNRPLASV